MSHPPYSLIAFTVT